MLGVADHFFQRLVAFCGVGDLHHFHFVELVLADHAARVAPGAAGFGAKARAVRGEFEGQAGFGQDFALHVVGQRHFGGGDEVHRLGLAFLPAFLGGEQVGLELGQLAGAAQRPVIDDVGRVALIYSHPPKASYSVAPLRRTELCEYRYKTQAARL